jgi:hypothetical protein
MVVVHVIGGSVALEAGLSVLALQASLEHFPALSAQSTFHKVGLALASHALVHESALLAVRKHVIARSAVVFVGVKSVHLALGTVVVVVALDTVTYHRSTFVTSVVIRFEA